MEKQPHERSAIEGAKGEVSEPLIEVERFKNLTRKLLKVKRGEITQEKQSIKE